ncbi:MAG: polyprenyl synthetase family protein, partial [Actinomycetota bacterium]
MRGSRAPARRSGRVAVPPIRSVPTAFQVADDILDCEGTASTTGKAVGTDLIGGTATLPLLLAGAHE